LFFFDNSVAQYYFNVFKLFLFITKQVHTT